MGKGGVGKLSVGTMDAEETRAFLLSGDLALEGDQLADNYDMALYRPITAEDYQTILEQTAPYREAEEAFAALYGQWVTEEDAGRKAEYVQEYILNAWRITPNGNLKAFGKKAEKWGVMSLGAQTLKERILMFLVSF